MLQILLALPLSLEGLVLTPRSLMETQGWWVAQAAYGNSDTTQSEGIWFWLSFLH